MIVFKSEKITPKKAQELLENNPNNRTLRKRLVNYYATQMSAGAWEDETGETVKVSPTGRLLDGQHRLSAIVKSCKPQVLHMAYGVPDRAYTKIDTGLKRTAADALHTQDVKRPTVVAGIIRRYLLFSKGVGYSKIGGSQLMAVTNEDVAQEYKRRPNYWDRLTIQALDWYKEFAQAMYPSDLGGFYALFADIDKEDATAFFQKLCSGVELKAKSPILKLRQILIDTKMSNKRLETYRRSGLILTAWNLYRKHGSVEQLKFDAVKDEIPQPI